MLLVFISSLGFSCGAGRGDDKHHTADVSDVRDSGSIADLAGIGDSDGQEGVLTDLLSDLLADTPVEEILPMDIVPVDGVEPWHFDRSEYEPVAGWILLDPDPTWTAQAIDKAAEYGVNQIQLSHGHIMNVEDIIGDTPEIQARVDALNTAIAHAHEHGIRAYVWVHELSGVTGSVCWDPADPFWESRANAYRQLVQRLPDLDGVVMMFGSAPLSPWFAFCSCNWCTENWPGGTLLDAPPNSERIRMVTERLGVVVTNELGLDLIMRVFVHEPSENPWHAEGLASVQGLSFSSMHKATVQDWQPYNPPDPTFGKCGPHPSIVELDAAGEYWGNSVLPFCAPEYFWFLLQPMWANYGIGYAARIERGNRHALGTPNEINLLAVQRLLENPEGSLSGIWDEFLLSRYGLEPASEAGLKLRELLALSFPIRLKSHYVLGIWALGKNSDFPEGALPDEFSSRGKMPKWDPAWQGRWDQLDKPNKQVVLWVFQEGTEAVELAHRAMEEFQGVKEHLPPQEAQDLEKRLTHQWLSARAWRAMDLIIWGYRASAKGTDFAERKPWHVWAAEELAAVRQLMEEAGLSGVGVAEPAGITKFLSNVPGGTPEGVMAEEPPVLFSAMRLVQPNPTTVEVTFTLNHDADVFIGIGPELPTPELVIPKGFCTAGQEIKTTFTDLKPNQRFFVTPRAVWNGLDHLGGDMWLFTKQ